MTVDVFWVSPDPEWITRGYADCAFLETILRNELWQPNERYVFANHDVRGEFPHYDGAVVCFNGMGLAPHADWIVEQIDRMAWALVIITGNELWDFPWERLPETETRKVWVMNPQPCHAHLSNRLPGGWYTGTREALKNTADLALNRPYDWFLGAQIINPRRRDCMEAVRNMPRGKLITTETFMSGVPYDEWLSYMAGAKVAPCPSGPMTLDANRPLAALEAGTVPLLDMRKPLEPQFDYWTLVFGPDHPMTGVWDWRNEIQAGIDKGMRQWPRQSNVVFAWWQQWKRRTICQLHADIKAVSHRAPEPATPGNRITALITSSPIVSHPDTSILEQTVHSVREQLPDADIVIVFDGVRPEQMHLRSDYYEYVRRVLWKCNWEWDNVLPVVMDDWQHQANATARALPFVATGTMLFMEHDTPLVGDIPWDALIAQIEIGNANVIRLHQDVAIHADHERLMLDPEPTVIDGVPLRRTAAWWQRPHLADTVFYMDMLEMFFTDESRTMIEDKVYGEMWVDCTHHNLWKKWRVYVYQPDGDMRRSGHLDGRGDAPKYEMRF